MHLNELGPKTIITMVGDTDVGMINAFDGAIRRMLAKPPGEINIMLSSPGGASVYAKALFKRLRLLQKRMAPAVVRVIGMGHVGSHGVTLMMAFPKKNRLITQGTTIFVHHLQCNPVKQGSDWLFRPSQEQELMEQLVSVRHAAVDEEWIIDLLSKGTGKGRKRIAKLIKHGSYFEGKEAVKFGFAGSLLEED